MPAAMKNNTDTAERLKVLEKALANLADTFRQCEGERREAGREVDAELKALKLFLSRNMPEFKKQFPEVRRKVK